jgi:hypothetical protein
VRGNIGQYSAPEVRATLLERFALELAETAIDPDVRADLCAAVASGRRRGQLLG